MEKICTKKIFENENMAKNELKKIKNLSLHLKHNTKKKPIRVYECPNCNFWHLTSEPLSKYLNDEQE